MMRFLQRQYAGSTSLTALERYESNLTKLITDREECYKLSQEAKEENEKVKLQHEILSNRLQIVEQLKDILEQQIGSPDVQNLMQRFSEESQRFLSVIIYIFIYNKFKVINKHIRLIKIFGHYFRI